MTKNWKINKTSGRYSSRGTPVFHQDSGALVGSIFPGGSEIISSIVASAAQDTEELNDLLDEL